MPKVEPMAENRLRFTVLTTELRGRQVEFAADEPITIGRTSGNALVLEHKSVSRHHARIELNGTELRLVDLDSHNGTSVGDKPVTGEQAIASGDVLRFGEVQVQLSVVDPATDTPAGQSAGGSRQEAVGGLGPSSLPTASCPLPTDGVPAVVGDQVPAPAGERPLSFDDVFAQAAPETPAVGKMAEVGPLLFGLLVVILVAAGGYAIWRAGWRPAPPTTIGIQLRAGEVLPVNLTRHIYRVALIEEPETQRVAYAKKTKFRTFVTVHGRSVGDTDIVVHGQSKGPVTLRVLVRGVKPDPEWYDWIKEVPKLRIERAMGLIKRANVLIPDTGAVDEHTSKAIRDLEIANRLLANITTHAHHAAECAKKARELREARERRFDALAKLAAARRAEGDYEAADKHCQKLLAVFNDPESVEYLVVRSYYKSLLYERARAEARAQEKR